MFGLSQFFSTCIERENDSATSYYLYGKKEHLQYNDGMQKRGIDQR